MFFNQNVLLRLYILCSFLCAPLHFIAHEVLGTPFLSIQQKRPKVNFLVADEQKKDSVHRIIKQLLIKNNEIIKRTLSIESLLNELEESIRLQEIYEAIQSQQAFNETAENLKRSIKRRSYFSLGLGLLSSALLLAGSDNDNDNLRYGGAIISLSIPVIAIISMKRQLNTLAPTVEIDYSMLQSGSYPHNQTSEDFFRNYMKAEIFALKAGIQKLSEINLSCLDRLNNEENRDYLKKVIDDTAYIIFQLQGYYIFQIQKFNDLINNSYVTYPFDQGTRKKLERINRTIDDELSYFRKQSPELLSNQEKINLLFE